MPSAAAHTLSAPPSAVERACATPRVCAAPSADLCGTLCHRHPTSKKMSRLDYQEPDTASPVKLVSEQQRSVASFFSRSAARPRDSEQGEEPFSSTMATTKVSLVQSSLSPAVKQDSSSGASRPTPQIQDTTSVKLVDDREANTADGCGPSSAGKRARASAGSSARGSLDHHFRGVGSSSSSSKMARSLEIDEGTLVNNGVLTHFENARVQLVHMGFDTEKIEAALEASGGEIPAAVAILCSDVS